MKFKIDENLPIEVVEILQQHGYDASHVIDENLQGCSDKKLISVCRSEQRVLVTLDKDFSNILKYPPEKCRGIIVLKLKSLGKKTVITTIKKLLMVLQKRKPSSELWILEENKIRIKK